MDNIPETPRDCPNLLLAMLDAREYNALRPDLELVPTPTDFKLYERNKPIQYAYFPCSGEHSVIAMTKDGLAAEVGTIGYEGFSTVDLLLEAERASETTVCQVAGESLRLSAKRFKELVAKNSTFARVTRRYMQAYIAMISQSIACNALHTLEQRFARLMLMTHERVHGNEFHLTQQYIAIMLGTRRPTVSVIAREFQRAGILKYHRGVIAIQDRSALEASCCECYEVVRNQFERFLGAYPTNSS